MPLTRHNKAFWREKMRYLHKRRIEVDCWLRDDQRLQVVGEIDDDKGMPFQSYQRLIPAGGNLHTMRVTWIVRSEEHTSEL